MMASKEENIMNRNKKLVKAAELAQFKFALIAPVIQGLFNDPSRQLQNP